jgi:hypothetical protein
LAFNAIALALGTPGNVIEAAQIGVRQSDRLTAGKSSPGNFGLLQHNLPFPDSYIAAKVSRSITHHGTERKTPAFGAGVS